MTDPTVEPESTPPADAAEGAAQTDAAGASQPAITLEAEMKRSYLDYAMSVIISRALPDVRDGLKPVQRRILYAMRQGGYDWNRAPKKSSKVVGEVMGNFHPHGDAPIYGAVVRLAQGFAMRVPLVEGQGNFGSMDGDPPAAMRYTEARLSRIGSRFSDDIDKDIVDWQANYDETTQEPRVLPAPFPNLLVNGAEGIAVGMATSIPPHNLGEVIRATIALAHDPEMSLEALMGIVPGPDFPTAGQILGRSGIKAAYTLGRGSIMLRAKAEIKEIRKDREAIIITEVPYQVNKSRVMERVSLLRTEKVIEGIAEHRDESNRLGVRMVFEIKRDHQADVVLNQLYRHTPLQTSFSANMLAISGGRPERLTLKEILAQFLAFRRDLIYRRTAFDLNEARTRAHLLAGLAVAVANLDTIIALIRNAADPTVAKAELLERSWDAREVAAYLALVDDPEYRVAEDGSYALSPRQAQGILELRLQRLTGMEREKIGAELEALARAIEDYLAILADPDRITAILVEELEALIEAHATPRLTQIEEFDGELDDEALIPREAMVVTVTHGGYVKRVALDSYRAQRRGGKGRAGMATKDDDLVTRLLVCDTHTSVLFFSSLGLVYKEKVYRLPLGAPTARGKAFQNLLRLSDGEVITSFLPLPEDEAAGNDFFLMFATSSGTVRRNRLSDFQNVMAIGKIAMKLEPDERLIAIALCHEAQDVLLASARGRAIRFPVRDVRVFTGRGSRGVRGIQLDSEDSVLSMTILNQQELDTEERDAFLRGEGLDPQRRAELEAAEQLLLTVADDGIGKLSSAYEYRQAGRGGRGIALMDLSRAANSRAPAAVAAFPVTYEDELMLVSDGGQVIRMAVEGIRRAGRATRGVKLFNLSEPERLVSVARIDETPESADNPPEKADPVA